jgi:5-methylcytosine-specific restriction endonuclease McrA
LELGEIVAETDEATVYLAVASNPDQLRGVYYYTYPEVNVGEAFFVVVLRPDAVPPAIPGDPSAWFEAVKQKARAAMTLVHPAVAGFPSWSRIRPDDIKFVADDWRGRPSWGACFVWDYRRWLAKRKAAARRSMEFSPEARRSLRLAAGDRCQRCGATDGLEVDHIVPIALGGTNAEGNGLVLCRECHLAKTRAERQAFGLTHSSYPHRDVWKRYRKPPSPARFLTDLASMTGWSLDRSVDDGV